MGRRLLWSREVKPLTKLLSLGMIERLRQIRCILCDVDGVLTDGGLPFDRHGQFMKQFHAQDGAMLKLARKQGLLVGILSGRRSAAVEQRAEELDLDSCLLGVADKLQGLKKWLAEESFELSQVAYIGDDVPDLCLAGHVGLLAAVADASPLLRRRADLVLQRPGGRAAVAECLTMILQAQDILPDERPITGHG